jgi:predicted dehydrogenase
MLGTGLIGDFYTTTSFRQRGRDRSTSLPRVSRGRAFSERWGIPEHTTDMAAAVNHPGTDVVVVGAELPP